VDGERAERAWFAEPPAKRDALEKLSVAEIMRAQDAAVAQEANMFKYDLDAAPPGDAGFYNDMGPQVFRADTWEGLALMSAQ
jgi:hypothetical protein